VYTGPWLFGQTDCPSDSDADKLIRIASKGKFSAHDLRKFARSCWATIGIDYWVSERLLNHKQKGLDAVYIKADALDVKHAALTQYHQWLKGRVTCGHYAGIENNKSAA
jgi:integrase